MDFYNSFLFCQFFPFLIENFQFFLDGLFLFVQFHKAGNIGIYIFLGEELIDLAIPCFKLMDLILNFFKFILAFAKTGLFFFLGFPVYFSVSRRTGRGGGHSCLGSTV